MNLSSKPAWIMSAAVFVFFAFNLVGSAGYSAGAGLALLVSVFVLWAQRPKLDAAARSMVLWAVAFVLVALWAVYFHQERSRELDLPLRYLALVFLLWAGSLAAPKALAWWLAVAVGSFFSASLALYDLFYLGLGRATGLTGGIQFGNIALLLGVFSAAGAVNACKDYGARKLVFLAFFVAAALAGLYASLASGSRGGWVALPVVVVFFAVALAWQANAPKVLAAVAVCGALVIGILALQPVVQQRYNDAVHDITLYQQGQRNTSLGYRFTIWAAAADLISQRPITGWGDAGYRTALAKGVTEGRYPPEVTELANTHNTYLEAWLKYGIFGVVALVGLFTAAFIAFVRYLRHYDANVRAYALCGISLVTVYAVASLSQIMLDRNNTLLFFLVALATLFNLLQARLGVLKAT